MLKNETALISGNSPWLKTVNFGHGVRPMEKDEEHGVSDADRAWVAQCKKYGEDPLACERTDSEKQNLDDLEDVDDKQQRFDF